MGSSGADKFIYINYLMNVDITKIVLTLDTCHLILFIWVQFIFVFYVYEKKDFTHSLLQTINGNYNGSSLIKV